MNQIKIIINGIQADLPTQELNLNLSYSLKDRDGFAINTGSRSEYSFEIPATKQNDFIFQRFYDVAENNSTKQVLLPASIEVNGLPFFTGLAQLTSVVIDADLHYWKGNTYKVSFYGNNVDWVNLLKNQFLYQYDFGTHTFDYSDILSYIYNDYNTNTFKYILIKWKDWLVSGQVDLLEFTPAIFIKSIIDRIFSGIGYTVDSTFFSQNSFQKLIMPIPLADKITDEQYGLDYLNVTLNDTQTASSGISGLLILPNQTYAPAIGSNPYNSGTGVYTVPADGYYLLSVECFLSNITTSTGAVFGFFINSTPPSTVYGQSNLTPPQPYTSNTTIKGEEVFLLNAGDTVSLVGTIVPVTPGTVDYNLTFKIVGEALVQAGTTIEFKYFINKSWNSLDFIKGLAHAFNLTFQTDVDNRTVTIEPADTYLDQSRDPSTTNLIAGFYEGTPYDMTPYVDLSKGGEVYSRSDINQLVKFTWQYDSADPTLEAINGNQDIALHQSRFTFTSNRFQRDEDVIENPFFSTSLVITESQIQGSDTLKTPIIPIIWSQNYLETTISAEANYDIMPRIFGTDVPQNAFNGTINAKIDILGTISNVPCPVAYMVDYNNTTGDFISLSFGTEIVNGYTIKGLLERFYLAEFIRRQSGKEVECYIFWDALMIQALNFRNPVRIHSDNYILQEINSFSVTSNQSTKTYLVYDDLGTGYESSQITNSLIIGKLNV